MALSKIDVANMLTGEVPNANVADLPQSKLEDNINFRNIIINGDMSVAQRSTSVSSITSDGYYTVDRFTTEIGSFGTWTQSQATDVPTGKGFATSLKMDCTTAQGSPGSSAVMLVGQSIEGQMLQYLCWGTSDAKQVTLSFWHKHTKTGTNIVELLESDNNDAVSGSYTQSVSDTWEKATITFPAKTSGAIDNDNARSLRIRFIIGSGTDYTSGTLATTWQSSITNANRYAGQVNNADSTSNNFIITGVQLEAGDTASEFEFLPYDLNLARCQRYYYKRLSENAYGPGSQGMQVGSSNTMIQGYHPVVMRSAPSMSGSNWSCEHSGNASVWSMGSTRTSTTAWSSENSLSGTDGDAAILYANNNTAADITGDAEL